MKRIWGKKSNLDDNERKGSEVYIPEKFHKLGHIEFIGKGSVSSVYKINGEKSYALKVVECGNNEKVYFDVLKEIDIMRKLKSCKGVVHILDSDIIDENGCKIVYILEEYLKTFSDYLKVKTLSVLQIVNTIRELCDALIECRNAGVAHLDIQPKNLFINEEGKIVVGDFGCSLYVEELKNNQIMRGTLAFMAPEVYREKRCSEQSEIYSIGINLYCLFNNNQLPFMDKDNEEVAVYKRLAGTSFTIMSYKGAFIQELYQIVKKACEYDYQKRFKTFEDMRSALTVLYNRIIDVEITVRNSDIRIKDANRSVLPVLYVVQNSSDMRGDAIAQVNKIGRETISILKKISNFQMSDIRVALMCCGNDVTWIQKDLISVCDFEWKMLEANGFLSMNMALQELDRRLTRDDKCDGLFSSLVTSCYKPVIIYISNGDVIDEEESCLTEIGKNIWYLRALKIGFLVGPDANIKGGAKSVGLPKPVLPHDYINQMQIKKVIGTDGLVLQHNDMDFFGKLFENIQVNGCLISPPHFISFDADSVACSCVLSTTLDDRVPVEAIEDDTDENDIWIDSEWSDGKFENSTIVVPTGKLVPGRSVLRDKQCKVCGNVLPPDSGYCLFCGTKVIEDKSRVELSKVYFSAIAPKTFVKGGYTMIDVVMYENEYRHVVKELISNSDVPVKETKSGTFKVEENSKIRMVLSSPDINIEDNEEEQEWQGDYLNFNFAVELPEDYHKRQILFMVSVFINDVISTRLKFIVKCRTLREQNLKVFRKDILSAFISYASQDRKRVAIIIQGMKKARPDMDIFFDIDSLRSGEEWEKALKSEIDKRDILFLCWSRFARQSKWVDAEWRYALKRKGIDAIEPVPIESPSICPPPDELNKKHFNDKLLYIIDATDTNKQTENEIQEWLDDDCDW